MRHKKTLSLPVLSMLLLVFACLRINAAELQLDLNGFRLEQFLVAAEAHLGKPFREIDQKDSVLRAYRIDEEAYMIVGHSKLRPNNISMLQLTGRTTNALPFSGLKLGDERERVIGVLGTPTKETPVQSPRVIKLSYDAANFSVELDDRGRLYSILIFNTQALFNPGTENVDHIENLKQVLAAGKMEKIIDIIRPDVEIYRGGKTLAIRKRLVDFIANPDQEFSEAFFDAERGVVAELRIHQSEVSLRLTQNFGMGYVYKFPPESRLRKVCKSPSPMCLALC